MPVNSRILDQVRQAGTYTTLPIWPGTYLVPLSSRTLPENLLGAFQTPSWAPPRLWMLSRDLNYRGPVGLAIGRVRRLPDQSNTSFQWEWCAPGLTVPPLASDLRGSRRYRIVIYPEASVVLRIPRLPNDTIRACAAHGVFLANADL